MDDRQTLSRRQAIEQVAAQLDGPIALDEFCQRVLAIWPSTASKPLATLRTHLRQEQAGQTVIFLDTRTLMPVALAMRGVRFRITPGAKEVERGLLFSRPAFDYFLNRKLDPARVQFLDAQGHPLPVRIIKVQMQVESPFGTTTVEMPAFDLPSWFQAQGVQPGDDILVTVEDWTEGRFRLEHEPAAHRRQEEIERKDQELADRFFDMLEAATSEMLVPHMAVLTAYARLSDPRGYPGHHWIEVLDRDPRMSYDGLTIRYSDWRSPWDRFFYEEEPPPQVSFSPAQGQQVYRFHAAFWYRPGLGHMIEIQGRQTLADFDQTLRDAFRHDPTDHLGGFWKLVRRGEGKRFREVEIGHVDPLGGGSGAGVQIAGLGLAPGDELKYVYDFGDWVEHRLTLQAIAEPEKGTRYPRIVARSKGRSPSRRR